MEKKVHSAQHKEKEPPQSLRSLDHCTSGRRSSCLILVGFGHCTSGTQTFEYRFRCGFGSGAALLYARGPRLYFSVGSSFWSSSFLVAFAPMISCRNPRDPHLSVHHTRGCDWPHQPSSSPATLLPNHATHYRWPASVPVPSKAHSMCHTEFQHPPTKRCTWAHPSSANSCLYICVCARCYTRPEHVHLFTSGTGIYTDPCTHHSDTDIYTDPCTNDSIKLQWPSCMPTLPSRPLMCSQHLHGHTELFISCMTAALCRRPNCYTGHTHSLYRQFHLWGLIILTPTAAMLGLDSFRLLGSLLILSKHMWGPIILTPTAATIGSGYFSQGSHGGEMA